MGAPLQATHNIVQNSPRAAQEANSKMAEARGAVTLATSDDVEVRDVIYVINILNLAHEVNQPPLFPRFMIPACPKNREFVFTLLPRYYNEVYEDYAKSERYYRRKDGRLAATSLLNPAVHPGNPWEMQFRELPTHGDQQGNNLNAFGVFWTLTHPDDPKLKGEIEQAREVVRKTMNKLVTEGEICYAAGKPQEITPRMHFAADYLGLKYPWHQTHERMVECPNCGESIREGLAYHRNAFGEKCVIDWLRAYKAGAVKREDVPFEARWWEEEEDEQQEEEQQAEPVAKPRGRKA
jgi:hypothetical protein